MTALEMYREDRQNRRHPEKLMPRQEYFHALRDALYQELMEEGRSEFLEEMIAECSNRPLPVLEFSALRECFAAIVDNRRMKDASQYVPHILSAEDQPLPWSEVKKGATLRVDDPQMPDMLIRLRNVSWQLVSARDQTAAASAERAVSREIAGLRAVNHALETDNTELRAERDALRARIAELEEGVISAQLRDKITVRLLQSEQELEQQLAEKRRQAEQTLQDALNRAALEAQRSREEAERQSAAREAQRTSEADALRQEMTAFFQQQMDVWQQRLSAADYRFLAQSYAALRGLADRTLPGMLGGAQGHGADEALLTELAGLDAGLHERFFQMEQAMMQLGLRVVIPEVGERFDEALHSPAVAVGSSEEGLVARVESPAVVLRHSDGRLETLVRAVVHTR